MTVYNFYAWPTTVRPRVAQVTSHPFPTHFFPTHFTSPPPRDWAVGLRGFERTRAVGMRAGSQRTSVFAPLPCPLMVHTRTRACNASQVLVLPPAPGGRHRPPHMCIPRRMPF